MTFAIADGGLHDGPDRSMLQYHYSPNGSLGIVPLPAERYRLAVNVPHDTSRETLTAEFFSEKLRRRSSAGTEVSQIAWTATFRVRSGVARSFRRGCCVLAGDAAHIVSPAGGQGMNVGLQDAGNLGWRLAAVSRGLLPVTTLDEYAAERRGAALRLARTTALQTRLGLIDRRPLVALRNGAFAAASRAGYVQRMIAPRMAQTDVSYAGRPGWRHGPYRAGDRLSPRLFDPGQPLAREPIQLLWRDGDLLASAPPTRLPGTQPGGAIALSTGDPVPKALLKRLGSGPARLLVRPDGHIAAIDRVPADIRE